MIRMNHISADTAVIHDFCMLPSCQGKGYGRIILAYIVSILLSKNCSQIRLSVVTDNRRALNLYRSAGFEVSAESHYYTAPVVNISQV